MPDVSSLDSPQGDGHGSWIVDNDVAALIAGIVVAVRVRLVVDVEKLGLLLYRCARIELRRHTRVAGIPTPRNDFSVGHSRGQLRRFQLLSRRRRQCCPLSRLPL